MWWPKHDQNRTDIRAHASVNWGKLVRPRPYTKNYLGSRGTLRAGEVAFPRGEHRQPTVNPENIHTSSSIQTEQVTFMNVYIHTPVEHKKKATLASQMHVIVEEAMCSRHFFHRFLLSLSSPGGIPASWIILDPTGEQVSLLAQAHPS